MSRFHFRHGLMLFGIVALSIAIPTAVSAKPGGHKTFIDRFHTITTLAPTAPASGSAAGDINPYGVAVVKHSVGDLVRGDVLVSNFNNAMNQQGTGSSIVEISPSGAQHTFAVVPQPTSTPAVGLTTALVELRSGFVIVGSLPAPGGDATKMTAGALTILNSHGAVVNTLTGGDINGPWDMTAVEQGNRVTLFVTNVLNGTVAAMGGNVDMGTVVRITLRLSKHHAPQEVAERVIGTGFREHTDPNALVVGPTGIGLGRGGMLYVADSGMDRVAAIPNALKRKTALGGGGHTVAQGGSLMDPLGLLIAPNGDIVTANGGDGNLVETSPGGSAVSTKELVANGAGDLFGLALRPGHKGIYFVNDSGSGPAANSLQLLSH